ncbi:hypothetical protein T265_07223 [Opisthorchis viverrini]|uniref:Uncharacterized protein n=1 Tax=Opisthorchis viverrini TaxID=6198 RepID=A0A074ZDB1_OPIVI|nr:hypothetical protein T265_07223 [Opisthorchis viverrini]KER25281.1 hypothetical protein T265_07223 [Opisthorchis viverrini]
MNRVNHNRFEANQKTRKFAAHDDVELHAYSVPYNFVLYSSNSQSDDLWLKLLGTGRDTQTSVDGDFLWEKGDFRCTATTEFNYGLTSSGINFTHKFMEFVPPMTPETMKHLYDDSESTSSH